MALATGVESANVVGYQEYSLNAGQFYMIGVQFGTVGTAAGIPMKDLITGNIPYGTQIQVLKANGQAYDFYKYMQEAWDETLDDFTSGWANTGEEIVYTPVPAGTCFWLTAPSAATVKIAGQVLASSSPTSITGGQFSMVANPFPVALNLNDAVTWTGLTYGDQIQVLKANGQAYDFYKYMEEGYDENLDDFVPGWANTGEIIVHTGVIPVGQGFWINPKSNVTMTFSSPL